MTIDVIDAATNTRSANYTGPGTIDANAEVSAGVTNTATFNWTGSGNAVQVNLGFRPRHATLYNMTDNITWEWVYGMAATDTLKVVAAGTRTVDSGSSIVSAADAAGNDTLSLAAAAVPSAKVMLLVVEG